MALTENGKTEKIEQQAQELQKALENNDMKPLWNYQKNLRKPKNNSKHTSIYQQDNKTETHDEKQTLKRWTGWITQQFSQTQQESKNIQIDHIEEETRKQSELHMATAKSKNNQPPNKRLHAERSNKR